MFHIICGTNRPGSRSLRVSEKIYQKYKTGQSVDIELIDLAKVPLHAVDGSQYQKKPDSVQVTIDSLNKSRGIIFVIPEYNGSIPGALKYFIDHWDYPYTFDARPVCFVGIGGKFGGLRPVEHLQQIMGYRNAFIYPERVFYFNVWTQFEKDLEQGSEIDKLLDLQIKNFISFSHALHDCKLASAAKDPSS